jgi:hypothetical protein
MRLGGNIYKLKPQPVAKYMKLKEQKLIESVEIKREIG